MPYVESWEEFAKAAELLYLSEPSKCRFVMKYRHSDGKLVLKCTDNSVCVMYATQHSHDIKKVDKLTTHLMRHMASKDKHCAAIVCITCLMARKEIMSLSMNEEHTLFAASMDSGVKIFNIEPLMVRANLEEPNSMGSVAICQLLHRTNVMALVAGGSNQRYSERSVLIWDDALKKFVLELTFSSPVLAVKTRRDRIIVVERHRIHCFSFPQKCQKLFSIETRDNPLGLCEVTPYTSSERQLLVFPGHRKGSVHLLDLTHTEPGLSSPPINISAHQSDIACLAINKLGTMVATASTKGTLIRVFDTSKRTQLVELRRGADPATLYCIAFSHDSDFLVVSSDKGTVHIFALKDTHLNRRSTFSSIGFAHQYVDSQWALAKFTIAAECACICAFGPDAAVYAICVDGSFHKYHFNADGTCLRDSYDIYLDVPEDDDM
ncbi:unnamed protein product [Medioppia subpectinata]|uniref:Signal recognition particle 9 kDa protein n=1 Tax=Medioppia subpectinata TaxID=1979941 RepID=A0A7R9KS31_9ACAR|nr:unnamed protein product [Medioppia subpectinata]CAG2107421.1 unnamed protein product [Medioppia subpectinata]